MSWNRTLKERFVGRQVLSTDDLIREFGLSGPTAGTDIQECLGLFEQEYGVPAGLLRATDSLTLFTDSPPRRNPFSWLFTRAAYEDSTSELNFRLKKRRRFTASPPLAKPPMTVCEYVMAWVGRD